MGKGPRRRSRSSRASYKRRRREDARRMAQPSDPGHLVTGSDLLADLWGRSDDRDSGGVADPDDAPDRD